MRLTRWFMLLALANSFAFGAAKNCESGKAGAHPCLGVHLSAKLYLGNSGKKATRGNDIWGWTDPDTNREYAIMGLDSKASFVDITDPKPVHIGDLPTATRSSVWRDIKVYKNFAFIVSEAPWHGMQVFDLTKLRKVSSKPALLKPDVHYKKFGSAHNIVINEDSGFAYAVGTDTCDAGMHVVDIRNPKKPKFVTCIDKEIFEPEDTGRKHGQDYTHDAQCVMYKGPDADHKGKEICVCSNADTVNIVDTTNKSKIKQISVKAYTGLGYTHQGWLTEDHKYFLLGDELDEARHDHPTKTFIWDVQDLDNPKVIGSFFSDQKAIDHNMYVKGNIVYQANYDAGVRVLDLSKVHEGKLKEIGFFDTEPKTNKPQFRGAWSVFPYFESNTVVVSNIDGTLYVLRPDASILSRM